MKIRNKRSGRVFEVDQNYFEQAIVNKGNADVYDVIEGDAPLEVKNLKIEIAKRKAKEK